MILDHQIQTKGLLEGPEPRFLVAPRACKRLLHRAKLATGETGVTTSLDPFHFNALRPFS